MKTFITAISSFEASVVHFPGFLVCQNGFGTYSTTLSKMKMRRKIICRRSVLVSRESVRFYLEL